MENVKGILSSRINLDDNGEAERVFEHIRRDLGNPWEALLGDSEYAQLRSLRQEEPHVYRLYSLVIGGDKTGAEIKDSDFLIRSEEFGIPQRRHRVILLGVRDDIPINPTALRPSGPATVRKAIELLPRLRSSVSRNSERKGWFDSIRDEFRRLDVKFPHNAQAGQALFEFLTNGEPALNEGADFLSAELHADDSDLARWYVDHRIGGVIQHVARSHMVSDLVRYLYASSVAEAFGKSPALEDWPAELLPAHRNVEVDNETGRIKAEGFNDRFKVQIWDQPSSTITSHIAKDGHYFIHPDPMQCRSLTVREAARLQTFPDNYFFCGNRTQQYHQVGNAVPPYLACQIAGVVAKLLEDAGLTEAAHG
jgi:DNA (cytosine-5)-methyltransferase 1